MVYTYSKTTGGTDLILNTATQVLTQDTITITDAANQSFKLLKMDNML